MSANITALPSDARTDYACHCLMPYGAHLLESWENFPDNGIILTGIPFTKNGKSLYTSLLPFLTIDCFLKKLTPNHILIGGNFPAKGLGIFMSSDNRKYCQQHNTKSCGFYTPGCTRRRTSDKHKDNADQSGSIS